MKKLFLLMAMVVCSLTPNPATCDEWTGDINLLYGVKRAGGWRHSDQQIVCEMQNEVGILVDLKQKKWPINVVISYLSSFKKESIYEYDSYFGTLQYNYRIKTTELGLGVKKIWDVPLSIHPYIGAGIALVNTEAEANVLWIYVSDEDTVAGLWFCGGVYLTISKNFNVGFEYRLSHAEATMFDEKSNMGGIHAGLFLGYHW